MVAALIFNMKCYFVTFWYRRKRMKKRILLISIMACMLIVLSGCGDAKKKYVMEEKQETGVNEFGDTDSDRPVLGDENADYSVYEYLYAEHLRTESEMNDATGKMESKEVTVLVPESDYVYSDRTYASSNSKGVSMSVEVNPYFRFGAHEYTLTENLEEMVANNYDVFYTANYKDVVISDATELDNNSVVVYIDYLYYQNWNDMYVPMHDVFFARKLDDDITILVELQVDLASSTGNTQALIDEIEAFYRFDVAFDIKAMEEKVRQYVLNDTSTTNTFSTGYMLFELPKNWDEDYGYDEDYEGYDYAPDGDGDEAYSVITIKREYRDEDDLDVEYFLRDPELSMELFLLDVEEEVFATELIDMGVTELGRTMRFSFDMIEEGENVHIAVYIATDEDYLYTINAMYIENYGENAIEVAENIVATAKVRKY